MCNSPKYQGHCGAFNKSEPHRLVHLNVLSLIGETVWERLGNVTFCGDVSLRQCFEVSQTHVIPSMLSLLPLTKGCVSSYNLLAIAPASFLTTVFHVCQHDNQTFTL